MDLLYSFSEAYSKQCTKGPPLFVLFDKQVSTWNRKPLIWQQVLFCQCQIQWQSEWSKSWESHRLGGKGQNGIFLPNRDWEYHGSTWSFGKCKCIFSLFFYIFISSLPPWEALKALEWLSKLSHLWPRSSITPWSLAWARVVKFCIWSLVHKMMSKIPPLNHNFSSM